MAEPAPYVFISHARADTGLARQLSEALTAQGFSVGSDGLVAAGEDWVQEIETKLAEAELVLLSISPEFLSSPSANFEAGMALSRRTGNRRVVPILLRGVSPEMIPFPLKRVQSIVASGVGERDILEKLAPVLSDFRVSNHA